MLLGWPLSFWLFTLACFYLINQSCTPTFLNELVKTESDFLISSVETDVGR